MEINEKNKSGRKDRMQGWQSSMKKTAGNDILHRPGDASTATEATTRERVKWRGRGGRGGEGREVVGSEIIQISHSVSDANLHSTSFQTPTGDHTCPDLELRQMFAYVCVFVCRPLV